MRGSGILGSNINQLEGAHKSKSLINWLLEPDTEVTDKPAGLAVCLVARAQHPLPGILVTLLTPRKGGCLEKAFAVKVIKLPSPNCPSSP